MRLKFFTSCFLLISVFSATKGNADDTNCDLNQRDFLFRSKQYSSCEIEQFCKPSTYQIRSREIDVKDDAEAAQIVEQMRNYGCAKVANRRIAKGKYEIFSTDCALTSSSVIPQGFPSGLIELRKGATSEGQSGPWQIQLALSEELKVKPKSGDKVKNTSPVKH